LLFSYKKARATHGDNLELWEKKITKNPKQSSLNEKKIISCLLKKQAGRDIKFQIRSLSITFLYILAWNP
jgi:hypothetical protein